jgi:hypothetical protein
VPAYLYFDHYPGQIKQPSPLAGIYFYIQAGVACLCIFLAMAEWLPAS